MEFRVTKRIMLEIHFPIANGDELREPMTGCFIVMYVWCGVIS
jgi:hypothetical protein